MPVFLFSSALHSHHRRSGINPLCSPWADAIAMTFATVLTILFMRTIKANKEDNLPPLGGVKENIENAK